MLSTATPTETSIELDEDCAKCQENLTDADAAALAEGRGGVVCDPSCFMGDTLYCNIFGLVSEKGVFTPTDIALLIVALVPQYKYQ